MNIIEALKSGKNFKRKDWSTYLCYHDDHRFNSLDILADDWEVEESEVTITRSQFDSAWDRITVDSAWDRIIVYDAPKIKELLAKELGL